MTKESVNKKFNLKTDDDGGDDHETTRFPNLRPKQGRLYSTEHSREPGGIRVEEMLLGVKLAHLSISDDSDERLKGASANTMEALKWVYGSEEEARKPLSTLLRDHYGLALDYWIDESGYRYGRAVDTQGFIASNDEMIVLSFRFSTSIKDWLTNINMWKSEWEPDVDEKIGHAGLFSCLDGRINRFGFKKPKPRVHTGFYNNFIYCIPHIKKYIVEPMRDPNCTPKKVYVCGTSLGAAMAAVATCYLLLEVELENLPHKVINVTAGGPRVGNGRMYRMIKERMKVLRPLDKAVICRLVYNEDVVPHIPLNIGGYVHLDKLVYITTEGDVIVNPRLKNKSLAEIATVVRSFRSNKKEEIFMKQQNERHDNIQAAEAAAATARGDLEGGEEKSPFEIEVDTALGPVKDHMPYWYLTNLENLRQREELAEMVRSSQQGGDDNKPALSDKNEKEQQLVQKSPPSDNTNEKEQQLVQNNSLPETELDNSLDKKEQADFARNIIVDNETSAYCCCLCCVPCCLSR